MSDNEPRERVWPRVLGLLLLSVALAVLQPILLIGLPFALLVLVHPGHRLPALALAGIVLALSFTGAPQSGIWYLERGWAVLVGGWFVALTLAWPNRPFTPRALGALGGALGWAAALFLVWPQGWTVTDWVVSERILQGSSTTVEALRTFQGEEAFSETVLETVGRAAELQGRVFPALLGLSTVAGLGVAWWLHQRLALGRRSGLGPLGDFRFHDHLIWLLIGGILLVGWGWGEGWNRFGENVVVFMGALYALRGVAVLVALTGGVSVLGAALGMVAMILAAPLVLAGALAVGLGDTWFDLRSRFRHGSGAESGSNGTN